MQEKIQKLIRVAEEKMRHSNDPIHDLDHVQRVVAMVKQLGSEMDIDEKRMHALILGAWWHDVARTITKKPSFVYMVLLDDIISSIMLWGYTIRYGLFGSVAGMAIRIILCKSVGSGKLFTKIFTTKKTRILVDLLEDADNMDALRVARVEKFLPLIEESYKYYIGYRILAWWNFSTKQLDMRTDVAKKHANKLLTEFHAWIETKRIQGWHEKVYGKQWMHTTLGKIKQTLRRHLPQTIV